MKVLSAIKIMNALLSVGIQYYSLKKMMQTLQDAQEQGRDITDAEWESAMSSMDKADANLARAIQERMG